MGTGDHARLKAAHGKSVKFGRPGKLGEAKLRDVVRRVNGGGLTAADVSRLYGVDPAIVAPVLDPARNDSR